jgi:apolipoprotein N-acyltransferase
MNFSSMKHFLFSIVMSLVLGVTAALAFTSYPLGWLTIPSLAGLMLVLYQTSFKEALIYGFSYGLGYFGVGVSWVYVSIHTFGNLPVVLSFIFTSLFVVFMSFYPALQAGFSSWFEAKKGRFDCRYFFLHFPASWMLFEFLRATLFSGFAWNLIAYSQVDTVLKGFIPVLGQYGESLLVASVAGAIAWMTLAIYQTIQSGRKGVSLDFALKLTDAIQCAKKILLFLPMTFLLGFTLNKIQWTQTFQQPLKVVLVQGNIAQDQKWQPEVIGKTIEQYLTLTEPFLGQDLIVWPEGAVPIDLTQAKELITDINREAAAAKTSIMLGIPIAKAKSFSFYNALLLVGHSQGLYYKRHLVAFGEYIPFETVLSPIIQALKLPFGGIVAGESSQPLLEVKGIRFAPFICYEITLESFLHDAMPDSNALVVISDDAWFGHSFASSQHLQIAQFRALESGRPLIMATDTGITAFIDEKGHIIKQAPEFEVATLQGEMQAMRGNTPWMIYPEWLWLVLAIILLWI